MKKTAYLFVVLFPLLTAGCFDNVSYIRDDGFTYTINLQRSGTADGVAAYGKIVAGGDTWTDTAVHLKSTSFSGGMATLVISGIEEGTYRVYVHIDLNGSEDEESDPQLGCGEPIVILNNSIAIDSDLTDSISDGEWLGLVCK